MPALGSEMPRMLRRGYSERWGAWRSVGVASAAALVLVLVGVLATSASRDAAPLAARGVDDGGLIQEYSPTVNGEICNTSIEPPQAFLRSWDLAPGWRRICELRNRDKQYVFERNWCWIGMKWKCHLNLKAHHSWTTLQRQAANEWGNTPPISDAPFHPLANPEVCDRPENGVARKFSAVENVTARTWFRNNVAIYVLNLPTDIDRWRMVDERLKELQIWATRVAGVDMRAPGAIWAAKHAGWVPKEFNFSKAQGTAYTKKQAMGSILGTLGCAAAHFKAQQKIIADGSPLAVVIEDDSYLADDFVPRLWSLVREELPCDWNAVALMSRCPYGKCISPHLSRVMPDGNEPHWRCHQGVNWGMHAVLYRTETLPKLQEKWKQAVFDENRPHCLDVDVALASISDQVGFYAVPAVQDPGFLYETTHPSARWSINEAAKTTSTRTTTSFIFVPTLKPGEPWPGAWSYG